MNTLQLCANGWKLFRTSETTSAWFKLGAHTMPAWREGTWDHPHSLIGHSESKCPIIAREGDPEWRRDG